MPASNLRAAAAALLKRVFTWFDWPTVAMLVATFLLMLWMASLKQ